MSQDAAIGRDFTELQRLPVAHEENGPHSFFAFVCVFGLEPMINRLLQDLSQRSFSIQVAIACRP